MLRLSATVALACVIAAASAWPQSHHPALESLPPGQWVQIHVQKPDDEVIFSRQAHGGATFDRKRGRLILFGSDTHGEDWANSPLFFDLATLSWSRLYPDDDPSTYTVNAEGIPVAGANGDHPWAMHTFGAVVYREAHDDVIVASYPQHLAPGRFTEAMANIWPRIQRHPTWRLDLSTGRWEPLPVYAEHFFAAAAAYAPDDDVVYGYKRGGMFSFGGQPQIWRRADNRGLVSYSHNMVYDATHKVFIVFGDNGGSNDIIAYDPRSGLHRRMPTPGIRPPPSQNTPMAFHERLGKVFVIVDSSNSHGSCAQTWAYDYGDDTWQHIEPAVLPFHVGMNYNMVYNPLDDVLTLVANPADSATAVWVLRLS